ncbi:MAG: ribonuclease Z [Alphaproteobacteria bacterium]|jgi:ribonuclease Z|nr:ribonuclease Z [Alphaproteobacteria bacterium]
MSTSLRPRLVNGRYGDPALFVEFSHQREAVLLDMGDLSALSARDLLRVGTVGVSHMHMDHLIGFDALLRVNVGRDARIELAGPEGFADRLGHKLQGYTWGLAQRYTTELVIEAAELVAPECLRRTRFRFSQRFEPEPLGEAEARGGMIFETPRWKLSASILEHHGPCLAFALEEPHRVNVWRNRLDEAGLERGKWLHGLKEAIRRGGDDQLPIRLPSGSAKPLSELRHLVSVEPGGKICYATDLRDTAANRQSLRSLGAGARILFIEASFRAADAALAFDRAHLTTRAAGEIARECEAKRVEPFHFSPRYKDCEAALLAEVEEAFAGSA